MNISFSANICVINSALIQLLDHYTLDEIGGQRVVQGCLSAPDEILDKLMIS